MVFRNSWRKVKLCGGEIFGHLWGLKRFIKIDILSHTESELQNSSLIGNIVMRDMWWQDIKFSLVCILFLHIMIFKKVWFMLLGFSCDGTCLSWIEFIFDLSMWAYIWSHRLCYGGYGRWIYLDVILIYILMVILDIVGINFGVYLDCCLV